MVSRNQKVSRANLETQKEQKENEGGGTRAGDMEKPVVKPGSEAEKRY